MSADSDRPEATEANALQPDADGHGEPSGSRRHHNIFVYYRGPSAAKETEHDAHRQLEDNTTKALINVLEHGSPTLAHWFAQSFALPVTRDWPEGAHASYYLQGGPTRLPSGQRWLLGVSVAGELDLNAAPSEAQAGSRIDAAIASPTGGLIAIETKVVDLLDPHQLARHRKRWHIAEPNTTLVRWVDVWSWACDAHLATPTSDGASRFLLAQLREYLEILGFGRWAGFREEDFEQFTSWSWDHQPILRARVRACWQRVLELMDDEDAAWLGTIEAGKLPRGATHAWAQTNRGQPGTNLTLELSTEELQFNLVGWNNAQAQRLASWLVAHAADAPDLQLVIHERRAQPDHKGAPFWMHATHTIPKTLTPEEVRAGDLARWLESWQRGADHSWIRLAYHLRHAWPRDAVLARGQTLAAEIASLATQSLPLLQAINGWKAPPPSSQQQLGPAHLAGEILEYEGNIPIPPGYRPNVVEDPDTYD
jgi:hypothetical protein